MTSQSPTEAALRLPHLLLALLMLALAAPGGAQDPEPSESESAEESEDAELRFRDEVEVEGDAPSIPSLNASAMRAPAVILKTPASVSVVSEAVMREQNGAVIGDVLRNASGVSTATGFGVLSPSISHNPSPPESGVPGLPIRAFIGWLRTRGPRGVVTVRVT
jgi:outer membrane receptor for monomeric catechols